MPLHCARIRTSSICTTTCDTWRRRLRDGSKSPCGPRHAMRAVRFWRSVYNGCGEAHRHLDCRHDACRRSRDGWSAVSGGTIAPQTAGASGTACVEDGCQVKRIECIIRPFKLDEVKIALGEIGVNGAPGRVETGEVTTDRRSALGATSVAGAGALTSSCPDYHACRVRSGCYTTWSRRVGRTVACRVCAHYGERRF